MLRTPSGMTLAIIIVAGVIVTGIAWPYLFRPSPLPNPTAPQSGPPYTLHGTLR